MKLQQAQIKLLDLVNKAYKGEVMLPDFQRNFVWTRNDIEELIKSLLEDMFIGTFLFMETDPSDPPFKTVYVQGADLVNPNIQPNPRILILDGQQRLTSLFYAIYSPNIPLRNTETPYAFFIDLEMLGNDNIEEAVFSCSKRWREYRSVTDEDGELDISKLKKKKILPLTAFSDINRFYELWYKEYHQLFSREKAEKILNRLRNILNYDVIALSLGISYNNHPEEIAALFERINRTGIKLSTYDLLVARLYKFIKLREEWETVFNNSYYLKQLADGRIEDTDVPFSLIQALVLANNKSIKSRDLIKIDGNLLNPESWQKVVEVAESRVLPRFFNRYGITNTKWIPYYPTITLMIAFYLKHKHPDVEKLDMWYWSSVFSERYSGSTETLMIRDFKEVSQWFRNNNEIPEAVEKIRAQLSSGIYTLKDVRRRGSSKYKGVFNLLFKNEAKDFYQPEDIIYNELNDHHIFPKKFLEAKKVNVDYDTILNRTLILDSTNKKISKKSPAEYIEEMIRIHVEKGLSREDAENKVKNILRDHFIDDEMFEILRNTSADLPPEEIKENFELFINKREKLIVKRICKLVGLRVEENVSHT